MAAITYTITNTGETTLTSLVFTFTTPPEAELHADFSTIKSGESTDFNGETYTISGLSILPTTSVTFNINYTYLTGNDGTYNGNVNVEGYSDTGSSLDPISIEIVISSISNYWYNIYGNNVDTLWSNGVTLSGSNIITNTEDGRLIEYNSYGDLESEKFVNADTTNPSYFSKGIIATSSQEIYIPFAESISTPSSSINLYLIKLNASKNIIWQKLISSSFYLFPNQTLIDSSNNVIVVGKFSTNNTTSKIVFAYKFDSDGNLIYKKHYSFLTDGYTFTLSDIDAVLDSSDNLYIHAPWAQGNRGILFKTNSSGVVQWAKNLESNNVSLDVGFTIDNENNLYLAGWDFINAPNFTNYTYLLKINSADGSTMFQKIYYYAVSNFDSPNGVGTMKSDGVNIYNAVDWYVDDPVSITTLLIKYDKNGNIIWQNLLNSATFGIYLEYWSTGNWVTFNDTDIIIGTTATNFDDPEKVIVVKMPKTGVATSTYCSLIFDSSLKYFNPLDSNLVTVTNSSITPTDIVQPSSTTTMFSIVDATPLPTFHCDIT